MVFRVAKILDIYNHPLAKENLHQGSDGNKGRADAFISLYLYFSQNKICLTSFI